MALRKDEGREVQHGWAELECEQRKRLFAHSTSPKFPLRPQDGYQLAFSTPLSDTDPLHKRISSYE